MISAAVSDTVCEQISLLLSLVSFTHKVKQTYTKEAAYCLNVDLLLRYDKTVNMLFIYLNLILLQPHIKLPKRSVGDDSGETTYSLPPMFLVSLEAFSFFLLQTGVCSVLAHTFQSNKMR